jgi:hypothetical protein
LVSVSPGEKAPKFKNWVEDPENLKRIISERAKVRRKQEAKCKVLLEQIDLDELADDYGAAPGTTICSLGLLSDRLSITNFWN